MVKHSALHTAVTTSAEIHDACPTCYLAALARMPDSPPKVAPLGRWLKRRWDDVAESLPLTFE